MFCQYNSGIYQIGNLDQRGFIRKKNLFFNHPVSFCRTLMALSYHDDNDVSTTQYNLFNSLIIAMHARFKNLNKEKVFLVLR